MWSDPERREEMKRRITEGIHKSDSDYYVRNKPKKTEETYHVPDLDGEVWKDIEGFEGHYAVSNLGRVKSLDRILPHKTHGTWHIKERILRQSPMGSDKKRPYLGVALNIGNGNLVTIRVHRAVAQAFVPNSDRKPEVNHIDGNKANNHADNLEWVTPKENMDHAWTHGLCDNIGKTNSRPVQCVETGTIYPNIATAEKMFSVAYGAIGHAVRKGYVSCGYHWKYADIQNDQSGNQKQPTSNQKG